VVAYLTPATVSAAAMMTRYSKACQALRRDVSGTSHRFIWSPIHPGYAGSHRQRVPFSAQEIRSPFPAIPLAPWSELRQNSPAR